MVRNFRSIWIMLLFFMLFFFVTLSELIVFFIWFYHFVTLNIFFSVTRSLLIPYPYVYIESIDCILGSSSEFNPEMAGREGWGSTWFPIVLFSKMYLLKRGSKPVFFVNFDIIVSPFFLETDLPRKIYPKKAQPFESQL